MQYPENSQSFNRYSYVHNNPLSYKDPSGYGFFSKVWKKIKKLIKPIVAVVVGVLTGGAALAGAWTFWGSVFSSNALIATATFATTGAIGGFVAGGILTGSLDGALKGAAAGAIFGGITGAYGSVWNAQRVAANSLAGGVSSEISGGKFADGMKFSLITSMVRVGWEYTRYVTNKLKLLSVENGGAPPSLNEYGELRTDGVRGPAPGVEGAKSMIGAKFGMSPEGAAHIYDEWRPVSRFINQVSKPHDFFNSIRYDFNTGFFRPFQSQLAAEAFEFYSFAGMPIAGAYTVIAQTANIPIDSIRELNKDD